MRCTILDHNGNRFSLSGECPHCGILSAFMQVTSVHQEAVGSGQFLLHAVMQCQSCQNYILGIVLKQSGPWLYKAHYPLGKPNENVPPHTPVRIAADFKEALRCRWVKAFNATAEMCRRAIESSCIDLGVPKSVRKLEDKIDWLAEKRKITPFLQEVAHKIRLGGNRGAHPPEKTDTPAAGTSSEDGENGVGEYFVITEEHADAIIKFTREYFHHVYTVPKELDKYDFSKASTTGKKT